MGNTYLRPKTREDLQGYAGDNRYTSLDDAVVNLLSESKLLRVTQQKCELLEQLFEPYKLDEED